MDLEFLRPTLKYIPEVELPKGHVPFKDKMLWTIAVLALFFIMGVTYPLSVEPTDLPSAYQQMAAIFASHMGSIISAGIGPIVTASIILQLLVGAKMIDIDLTKKEGKALFQGAQKILTVLVAVFEAGAIVIGLLIKNNLTATADLPNIGYYLGGHYLGVGWSITDPFVMFTIGQVALGSILLMYMDEVVSKWGIGSGIGLFIAAGVSQEIMTRSFGFLKWLDADKFAQSFGVIPNFLELAGSGTFDLLLLFPVLATIIVFLVVVFCESMRIEIPLSYGGVRGVGGRYPIKFFYVSNIPVILAAALLANVQMLPGLMGVDLNSPQTQTMNILQQVVYTASTYLTLGNLHGVMSPDRFFNEVISISSLTKLFSLDALASLISLKPDSVGLLLNVLDLYVVSRLLIYLIVFLGLCILFGQFWIETTGLSSEQVAEQIQKGGMQIPGFRRDKRVIEKVLNRYIPQITIISSIAVGLVSVGADLLGAIGSGTGLLLTVGIIYRLYEEVQKEQMSEMNPAFKKLLGRS